MPQSASDRLAKYTSKFDSTVVSARYTAGKDNAVSRATVHQNAMADLAVSLRGILNTAGVKAINTVRFLGYANKLYKLTRTFTGATGIAEAIDASNAWVDKIDATAGDKIVMESIWNLFNAEIGAPPSPFPS